MAEELKPLDISHLPEVLRLVEELQAAGRSRRLQVNHEDVAVLVPAVRIGRSRGKPTDTTDPLWNIVGLVRSNGPGDVAENVDAYLAEAYAPREA
jgi:hypothetical protein